MKRSWLIIIAILIAIPIAYFLISPAFRVVEVDQPSPVIQDALDTMDAETKAAFDAAVEEASAEISEMQEAMPAAGTSIAEGTFQPRAHDVAGKALLLETDGVQTVRFEDFETINGPDLRIYLASDLSNEDIIDLGEIKATKGNVNYEIPEGVDTTKYNKVLVWCRLFGVLFSYAELTPV